jgi:hypothetical protein
MLMLMEVHNIPGVEIFCGPEGIKWRAVKGKTVTLALNSMHQLKRSVPICPAVFPDVLHSNNEFEGNELAA